MVSSIIIVLGIAYLARVRAFLISFNPASDPIDQYKICKNCVHYYNNDESHTCKQFGTIDVVSGKIQYYACSVTRSEELLCGSAAKFFVRQIPFNSTSS